MKNAEKPLLSISLLASNRLDTIPRCLDSLRDIREALPCELIIVDTSNNPEVYECLLSYTKIIEKFEWCNDFAKARNIGLSKAKGEWFMFIDDDEWFLDSSALIEFFLSGEYKEYGYAFYGIRSYFDEEFKTYSDDWVKRLVHIQKDTKFYSKIHEYIAPTVGMCKLINAVVGHSGYIYKTKEERIKHFERNSSLLKIMEEEEPENLRWKTQQIQEYRSIYAWEELEEYCKNTMDFMHNEVGKVNLVEISQVYIGYVIALLSQKKYNEVIEFYKKYEQPLKHSLFAKAYMDSLMAEAYYALNEYKAVKVHVTDYIKAYKTYKRNPKKYERESVRIILGETFSGPRHCGMNTILLLADLKLGNYKTIYTLYPKLEFTTQNQKLFHGIQIELLEALIFLNDDDMLKRFLKDTLTFDLIRPHMVKAILDWRQKDEVEFTKILRMVKDIDIWEWYKLYVELLSRKEIPNDEFKEIGVLFIREVPNIFQVPTIVIESFDKHGIQMEELYKELDFTTWKNHVVEHFECAKMSLLDELKESLEKSCLKEDIRFGYFMMLYSEQKLIHGMNEGLHVDEYSNLLASFSTYTCITYEALYGESIRELPVGEFPNNYHAALWIQKFFEETSTNLRGALPYLGKVAEVYPFLQESIKHYLFLIKTEVFK